MRKIILISLIFLLGIGLGVASARRPASKMPKIILLISEQNIEGPQRAWWASEIDLSITDAVIANQLIENEIEVIEPSQLRRIVKRKPAFRRVNISEEESIELGNLSSADYVVVGKAIASAGANVPFSKMRSCFANFSAKLIRVEDAKVIAYLDADDKSAHLDVISGGREALKKAAAKIAAQLVKALKKNKGGGVE